MANFNKILLVGNLTRDPQLSYLPSNTPVTEIGLAVNHRFRRQDGSEGEETLFIDCRIFGRRAEVLNQYCRKGQSLLVEGRLQLDTWQDRDGNNRSKHRVLIENFEFLGRGSDGNAGGGGGGEGGHRNNAPRGGSAGGGNRSSGPANAGSGGGEPAPDAGYEPIEDDDIPF